MAFKNEIRTYEEALVLKKLQIPYPSTIYWQGWPGRIMGAEQSRWTVDRERNLYLFNCGQDREMYEREGFVIFWGQFSLDYAIAFIAEGKTIFENSHVVGRHWDLHKISIPSRLESEREQIIQDIKEALTTYWIDGDPDNPPNPRRKITFSF